LADGPPEAVAYGSGTGIDRHKCEIVHRQPELAVLGHSLIHTCNRPAKSRALHFNPVAGFPDVA